MPEDFSLENSNPFQIEEFIGWVGGVRPISIRCPHCGTMGSFKSELQNSSALQYQKNFVSGGHETFSASVRVCPNSECTGLVFTLQRHVAESIITLPPELIDFDREDIPQNLLTTLKEAIACHAAGAYRAAAIMVRRLLEEICEDNSAVGKDLHSRIKELKNKITLPKELFDAMGELKALGNDAAHVKAKSYDTIDEGEAADSIELVKEILKARYQLKGLVERLKNRKNKSPAQD